MGCKGKYLILVFLMFPVISSGQERTFVSADSLTYDLYRSGKWNELINEAEDAINSGIDYKYLRQRLGYAYLITGEYIKASSQFEKALAEDSFDQFSLECLWLSYSYSGKEDYAGWLERNMFPELRKKLNIRSFKPIESAGIEYNYKFSGSGFRSDAKFYRAMIGTKLGSRVYIYQSFSNYSQSVSVDFTASSGSFVIKQPEYYARLRLLVKHRLIIRSAYHLISTQIGSSTYSGHMFLLGFAPDLDRFIPGMNLSMIRYNGETVWQPEIQSGYVFPGRASVFFKGTAAMLLNSDRRNLVLSPMAGMKLAKDLWLDGHASFGRMNLYNDYDGLYVYNSYDPIIMRSGGGLTYYLNDRISLWLTFSKERKEYYNYTSRSYNQFSYLGGLKLKI